MEQNNSTNAAKDKFQNDALAPMHTTEHILNQTMVRMFGCPRSRNSHIERKKSKCDYLLAAAPTEAQITEIENRVNDVINSHLTVYEDLTTYQDAADLVDLSKLPDNAHETIRLIQIGNYDICACIGAHVGNTSEIGTFKIISHTYTDGVWRVRFKLV